MKKAAEETRGQVLISEGELKLVPYHEISNGQTRMEHRPFMTKNILI